MPCQRVLRSTICRLSQALLVVIRTDSLPLVSHEKKRSGQFCTTRFLEEIHTLTTHLASRLAEEGGRGTHRSVRHRPSTAFAPSFPSDRTLSSFFLFLFCLDFLFILILFYHFSF
ncbi:hypothetical protein BKA59DRAFT_473453 [Fusarium tricinctum]|uniref:Transmembrane protein n=1 Tax=Fusarium tricinctum TaxID=61284 RepID=A0A8K0WDX5_9HYPO|nr:hypothetical protein BKA59DRAFT_473453 [Fusarium tricinctum]